MKRQKLMMAVLAAAALGITACSGSAPKETAARETAAQESAAGTEAGAAEETEEETAEETEPEREFLSVPLTDERCSITYEIFYPAEGVEYEEASVFGDPAHTFSSGARALLSVQRESVSALAFFSPATRISISPPRPEKKKTSRSSLFRTSS